MSELPDVVKTWHQLIETKHVDGLDQLLDDNIEFWSPVLHTPQKGINVAKLYLSAAFFTLGNPGNPSFKYTHQTVTNDYAILEFETELKGVYVNGVDMFHWNEHQKIDQFKVMVRPLKAINMLHEIMRTMLGILPPKQQKLVS